MLTDTNDLVSRSDPILQPQNPVLAAGTCIIHSLQLSISMCTILRLQLLSCAAARAKISQEVNKIITRTMITALVASYNRRWTTTTVLLLVQDKNSWMLCILPVTLF